VNVRGALVVVWACGVGPVRGAAGAPRVAVLPPAVAGPSAPVQQMDSLLSAARRAARAWRLHEFVALVTGSPGVMVRLGGTEPSAPLRLAQAAQTLQTFARGSVELEVEVLAVRPVDDGRAYAEVQRTFVMPGTTARRSQTLYLGLRKVEGVWRVVEVRLVP
jgi:hypothetical protein